MNFTTTIKINKKYLKFLTILLCLGLIISFIIYKKIDNTLIIEEIKDIPSFLSTPINYIFIHFIFLSILLTCSFFGLGFIIIPLYIILEITCIFYNLFIFFNVFKFNGLFFGIIYNIITKGVYLFILIIILKNLLNLSKRQINRFINQKNNDNTLDYLKNCSIYFIIILVNDIIIYFFAHKILLNLAFLIN